MQTSQPVMVPTPEQAAEVVTLPKAGRALLVGMTGMGKTRLKLELVNRWLQTYKRGRLLLIDSKPCFRAEWQVSGIKAAPIYSRWDHKETTFIPGSYVVPIDGHYKQSLDRIFKKSRIAIVQGKIDVWDELLECARVFYEQYSARSGPRLVDVDELADFWEVRKMGGILWQIQRSGRQMGVGFIGGTQRPVGVPKTSLTEADRTYLFFLKREEDIKSMRADAGLPKWLNPPEKPYEFRYWNFLKQRDRLNGMLFQLAAEKERV